jgi:hypothetical protein
MRRVHQEGLFSRDRERFPRVKSDFDFPHKFGSPPRESFRRLLSLSFWEESTFFSQIFSKIFSTQIGKTAIKLPPPKEIAKYVCFILTLWAVVAGLFGALLSIAVQMRRYKYRSLPQKFIGNFRYGDSSRVTYPTSQRGLYPWVANNCSLTTTSNPNSFVNNDVTVWPTCVPSAADNNAIEFEVVATCGKACLNP